MLSSESRPQPAGSNESGALDGDALSPTAIDAAALVNISLLGSSRPPAIFPTAIIFSSCANSEDLYHPALMGHSGWRQASARRAWRC